MLSELNVFILDTVFGPVPEKRTRKFKKEPIEIKKTSFFERVFFSRTEPDYLALMIFKISLFHFVILLKQLNFFIILFV